MYDLHVKLVKKRDEKALLKEKDKENCGTQEVQAEPVEVVKAAPEIAPCTLTDNCIIKKSALQLAKENSSQYERVT